MDCRLYLSLAHSLGNGVNMITDKSINRLFKVIDNSLFTINGTLDYSRVTDALILLADTVHNFDGDCTELWHIGENGACCLDDVIIGAYWHYADWHKGQYSIEYGALCSLRRVFDPQMTTGSTDNEAYLALEAMANEQ